MALFMDTHNRVDVLPPRLSRAPASAILVRQQGGDICHFE
jgi:hypothetical protein